MDISILLAVLKLILPAGTATDPSAVARKVSEATYRLKATNADVEATVRSAPTRPITLRTRRSPSQS